MSVSFLVGKIFFIYIKRRNVSLFPIAAVFFAPEPAKGLFDDVKEPLVGWYSCF